MSDIELFSDTESGNFESEFDSNIFIGLGISEDGVRPLVGTHTFDEYQKFVWKTPSVVNDKDVVKNLESCLMYVHDEDGIKIIYDGNREWVSVSNSHPTIMSFWVGMCSKELIIGIPQDYRDEVDNIIREYIDPDNITTT